MDKKLLLLNVEKSLEILSASKNNYIFCQSNKKIYFIDPQNYIYESCTQFFDYEQANFKLFSLEKEFDRNFFKLSRKKFVQKRREHYKPKYRKYKEILLIEQNGLCNICKKQITIGTTNKSKLATIDHIIPLSKGGSSEKHNLQLLCHPCNSAKDDNFL